MNMRATVRFVWTLARPWRSRFIVCVTMLLIMRASGLVLPSATKYVVDDVLRQHKTSLIPAILGAVMAAALLQALTSNLLARLAGDTVHHIIADIRQRLHAHLLLLPVAWHDQHSSGELSAAVLQDSESLRPLLGPGMIDFAGGVVTGIMAGVILLNISARLTAVVLVSVVVLFKVFVFAFRRLRPQARRRAQLNVQIAAQLTDSFAGVRVLRAYSAERMQEKFFAASMARWLTLVNLGQSGSAQLNATLIFLGGLAEITIIALGCREVIAGRLTLGGFVTFVVLLGFLLLPLLQIVSLGPQMADAMAAIERIRRLLAVAPEAQQVTSEKSEPVRGTVTLEDVSFDYEAEGALRGVSFVATPGTTTALVGCSGAGKTTVVGLLAGFYRPSQGRIFLDGHELTAATVPWYRKSIALVTQEPYLFNGSVRDNILLGRECGHQSFAAACRSALVEEFVTDLPLGYDTVVGERGVRLSGGQRQRICIARALLGAPSILLLDEATSSVDPSAEHEFRRALRCVMEGRTTIVVAHRLCTVREADQILVLESGRIVERGSHAELVRAGGAYCRMFEQELGAEADFLSAGRNAFDAPRGATV